MIGLLRRSLVPRVGGLLVLAGFLGLPGLSRATAQEEPAAGQAEDAEGVAGQEPGFESPRALVAWFLETVVERAQKEGDARAWTEAGRIFDLSAYPTFDHDLRGRTLAEKLIAIWDRSLVLDPARFPAAGSALLRDGRWVDEAAPPGRPDLAFEIVFDRGADGTWRVGPETVQRIEAIHRSVRALPVLDVLDPKERSLHERIRGWVPAELQRTGFLLEHWQWIGLLLLVALGVLLERFVTLVFRRFLARIGEGRYRLDKEVLERLDRPTSLFAVLVVLALGLPGLDLPADVLVVVDLVVHFLLGLAGIWVAYRLVDLLAWYLTERARATRNTFDDMIVPLVRRTAKIFVMLVGGVWVASRVTDDLWGVFAGLGIGSLAVGFAAKDSIENLFGTFTVLMDKPFQLGDWIKVGDFEGTVAEVGFRSTRIRTFYDSLISVPNSTFIDSEVDNLGARSWRRISTKLGVAYDTPPEKIEAFCEGIRQLLRDHPYTRKDSYQVYLNSFGPSALEILLYCFHEAPDWSTELRERHRLFTDILRLAAELNVEFAFPTQTLHLRRKDELPVHEDAPATPDEARYRGRQVAGKIAAEGLAEYGGEKPPPVVIE